MINLGRRYTTKHGGVSRRLLLSPKQYINQCKNHLSSTKSDRITRAGVYLKPALVQVAHAAVKSDKSPYYKTKYERISKRRGKKRAIIAIARMILTAIYNMFVTGEVWNPSDLYKIDMPQDMQNKQKEKAINQAIKLLIAQGIIKATDISVA